MNKESDFAHAMDRYEFKSGFATLLAATIRQVIPPWLGYLPVVFVLLVSCDTLSGQGHRRGDPCIVRCRHRSRTYCVRLPMCERWPYIGHPKNDATTTRRTSCGRLRPAWDRSETRMLFGVTPPGLLKTFPPRRA
jgi:hypothetical protein